MALLRNLEHSLSGLFEGTFGRVFRTEVRPTEIARKLAREMEINKRVSLSRTYAPTDYLVYLSPDDRSRYAGVERSIAEELGAYLLEHARRERLVLVRRPLVEFRTDPRLHLGEFGIEARTAPISAEEAEPRPEPQQERPRQERPAEPDRRPAAIDPHPSGAYDAPAAVRPIDDAPYADPYAGDPFDAAPPASPDPAPQGDPGWDESGEYGWEDAPARAGAEREPARDEQLEPAPVDQAASYSERAEEEPAAPQGEWLDPVEDWRQPEPDGPPASADQAPAPVEPRAPAPAASGMPWIDPSLGRSSRPQFAPPVVPPRPQAPSAPTLTLVVDGVVQPIHGDRAILGRSRTADVVVSDPSVSRQHCELRRDDHGWIATDLGSTNGTKLDGQILTEPRRIAPGQRITLGHAPAAIEVR